MSPKDVDPYYGHRIGDPTVDEILAVGARLLLVEQGPEMDAALGEGPRTEALDAVSSTFTNDEDRQAYRLYRGQ